MNSLVCIVVEEEEIEDKSEEFQSLIFKDNILAARCARIKKEVEGDDGEIPPLLSTSYMCAASLRHAQISVTCFEHETGYGV